MCEYNIKIKELKVKIIRGIILNRIEGIYMKQRKRKQKFIQNNLSHLTMMFGLLGTLCLIISHFIPCLTIGGLSKFLVNEEFYLILLAGLSMISIFFGDIILPTVTSGVALWFFIDYTNRITTVYKQYASTTTILYGIGYYLLPIGFALTVTYVVFGIKEKLNIRRQLKKDHEVVSLKDTSMNEEKPMSFTKSPLLGSNLNQPEIPVEEPVTSSTFIQIPEKREENTEMERQEQTKSIWSQEDLSVSESEQHEPTTESAKRLEANPIEHHFPEMPVKEPAPFSPTTNSAVKRGEQENPVESLKSESNQEGPKAFTSFYDFELSPEELKRNTTDQK